MQVLDPVASGDELPLLLTPTEFSVGTGGQIKATDPRLIPLLAGASAAIRRYCGWHVAPAIRDEYVLDYEGGPLVTLPTMRLLAVDAFSARNNDLDVDKLKWSQNGEIALSSPGRGMRLGEGFRAIRATIVHGFDLDMVADLKQIVQQVVGNAISSPLGATREQAGQVSIQWSTTAPGVSGGVSLLERDYAVLNQYRLPRGV